jgi:phage protein Gp37/Gp68
LEDIGPLNLEGVHWVIVGGESGPGARPMKEEWVEAILLQCHAADVPFFFKQWGGKQKKKAGRTLNNRVYDEMPAIIRNTGPVNRASLFSLIKGVLDSVNSLEVHEFSSGGPNKHGEDTAPRLRLRTEPSL